MATGLDAIGSYDWSRLMHAYGRAANTPGHLRALVEGDAAARDAAFEHLWSAVLHQGTAWTATAPAALVIAGLLADPRIDAGDGSIRADLVEFLAHVAKVFQDAGMSREELQRMANTDALDRLLEAGDDDAIYEDVDACNALYARAVLDCIEAMPAIADAVLAGLESPAPQVRTRTAMALASLANSLPPERVERIGARIEALARVATASDERSALVLALGDLGLAPRAFLKDASGAVRMCAALAPALVDDADATSELITALERSAGDIDDWFEDRPPQFEMRPRFSVVARLTERVPDFGRLVDAAVAIARVTDKMCVDFDWGRLLAAAFPDGSGQITTGAQRRYLRALVDRADLWDPVFGNPSKWFRQAGLPYDRGQCIALLDAS